MQSFTLFNDEGEMVYEDFAEDVDTFLSLAANEAELGTRFEHCEDRRGWDFTVHQGFRPDETRAIAWVVIS